MAQSRKNWRGDDRWRPGDESIRYFRALVNWVENRIAPDTILATALAGTGRTRPLCPYPAFASYNGSGDISNAASFTCTLPERLESNFDDN
jgi:feruloyl esterase